MDTVSFSVTVIAVLALTPIAMRVFARLIQPKRLEMAALGCELLNSPLTSDRNKLIVSGMLRDAFDYRITMLMAVVFPLFIVKIILRRSPKAKSFGSLENDEKFKQFATLHMLSIFAANPIFCLICLFELLIAVPILLMSGAGYKAHDAMVRANENVDRHLGYCAA